MSKIDYNKVVRREEDDGMLFEYNINNDIIHTKDYPSGFEIWEEYDENGNMIHIKDSDGYESWKEYDNNGNMIHYKNSNGIIQCKNNKGVTSNE